MCSVKVVVGRTSASGMLNFNPGILSTQGPKWIDVEGEYPGRRLEAQVEVFVNSNPESSTEEFLTNTGTTTMIQMVSLLVLSLCIRRLSPKPWAFLASLLVACSILLRKHLTPPPAMSTKLHGAKVLACRIKVASSGGVSGQ